MPFSYIPPAGQYFSGDRHPAASYAHTMSDERARLLAHGSLGRALLAEIVGFDDFAVHKGIDLPTKVEEAVPHLDRLASCDEPLALLASLHWNPLGFGFSGDHEEWEARLSDGTDALIPVAEALVACPAASWWWDPLAADQQRWLSCDHGADGLPRGEAIELALARDVEKEIEAQVDKQNLAFYKASLRHDNYSGEWWSAPLGPEMVYTSRSGPGDLPCIEIATMEDPLGPETFQIWAVEFDPKARVYEVKAPEDWARLVDLAPLDVTVRRDPDWSRWAGHHGPWFLPDWRVIGETFDAVHMTLGGYLGTRGMGIEVETGFTLLAGWDAGTALWLRDAFREVRYVESWYGDPGQDGLPEPFRLVQHQ